MRWYEKKFATDYVAEYPHMSRVGFKSDVRRWVEKQMNDEIEAAQQHGWQVVSIEDLTPDGLQFGRAVKRGVLWGPVAAMRGLHAPCKYLVTYHRNMNERA